MRKHLCRLVAVAALVAGFPLCASPASAHWNVPYNDSVDDNKDIDYRDYTAWDDARIWARDRWNTSGVVDIQLDTGATKADIDFMDAYDPADSWVGMWDPESGADQIIFNTAHMSGFTTAERRHVALHELGHALGLGDSWDGQVMGSFPYAGGIQYVQEHDQASYDHLWG